MKIKTKILAIRIIICHSFTIQLTNYKLFLWKKNFGLKNKRRKLKSKFIIAQLVLFLLFLFGCAVEDTDVSTRPVEGVTTTIISYGELNSLSDVPKKTISVQSSTSRLVQSSRYNFSVDTDQILMIQQGKYRAFSFPVIRSKPTEYLENLFLHPYNNGYLAFLLRFDFDESDMQKLANGTPITDIPKKMRITPLDGFDIHDLNIHDVSHQNTTTGIGDPVFYNGKCWRVNNVWENDNGEAMYDMIECPGCGCTPPSGGGGGGSSGSGGATYAQYLAIVDLSGGYWGSSGGGGSGGGSGGGGGSTNPWTVFNPQPSDGNLNPANGNPIIGIIIPHPSFNITNPCATLSDLGDAAKANFSQQYQWLKQKIDGTVPNVGERGVSMKRQWIDGERGYDAATDETLTGEAVPISIGANYYAAAHTHPNNGPPMFSFEDIMRLAELHQGAQPELLPDVANLLVCKNQATGEISTYSIKIDNPAALLLAIENKINGTPGLTREDKIQNIMIDQGYKYDKCNGNYELEFLQQFAAFGITLYRANDETFQSWTKLYRELPLLTVLETPC